MGSLDASIDELYKGPLEGFIAARTALARTLKGDDARRVKALPKPRVGPWAINQVYWHARPLYDRVARSGEKLRTAQIAALEGRAGRAGNRGDLRAATEAHHKAIGDAVTEAVRFGDAAGVHPSAEELIRTFEALSLARELPEHPGRLTKPLRPAGFEALAGVPVKSRPQAVAAADSHVSAREADEGRPRPSASSGRDLAAAERRRTSALQKAEVAVARAEAAEARARQQWERSKQALEQANRAFDKISG